MTTQDMSVASRCLQGGDRQGLNLATAPRADPAVCDDDAVCLLFEELYGGLCRSVSRVLRGDHALTEQVVMDAFVILYERRHMVRLETARAYVWRVALNEARTAALRQSREGQLVDLAARRGLYPIEGAASAVSAPDRTVEHADVRASVHALPIDQRTAVVLHYYCDWPDGDIAELSGCPPVTIRSRLRRARKSIEAQLVRARRVG